MKQVITGFQEVQDRERLSIEGGYEGPNTSGARVALRVLQDTGGPSGYQSWARKNRVQATKDVARVGGEVLVAAFLPKKAAVQIGYATARAIIDVATR